MNAASRPTAGAPLRLAQQPKVAVDTVLFAVREGRLQTYLVQLRRGPARGKWAFAGGLVRQGETLDGAARRELHDSTGLGHCYLEQLCTFGDPRRDPDSHVVSVAYLALIAEQAVAGPSHKYETGAWFDVTRLPLLAYDHGQMAAYAETRLRAKLQYSNIACALLPRVFTFSQFEQVYLPILDQPI
ncbi:MAG: NUDIX hydrolase, partial [Gemmataceae bacterium]